MPQNSPGLFLTHVTQYIALCREHFELRLACKEFPQALPGQFVQILCRDPESNGATSQDRAMLRRPFSIAGLQRRADDVELSVIGRVIGPGTSWLNSRREGDAVSLLGPLGRAFDLSATDGESILIAGGVGLPPIRWLAEVLRAGNLNCKCIFGAQTRAFIPLALRGEPDKSGEFGPFAEEFAMIDAPIAITTDDGSCGMRGRVTDCLARHLPRVDASRARVFACGPEPMLRAIADLCAQHDISCSLAMERVMGCGMGTCQSCVIPVRDPAAVDEWRYALCCTEGPVFDAQHILWPAAR